MKFIIYENFDIENNKDEIEHLKEHVEIVYRHVKDYLDDSDLLYILPDDDDSQHVFCMFSPRGEEINVSIYLILIEKEILFNNLNKEKMKSAQEHFIRTSLDDMFSKWDIKVFYKSRTLEDAIWQSRSVEI